MTEEKEKSKVKESTWEMFWEAGGYETLKTMKKKVFEDKSGISHTELWRLLKEPKRTPPSAKKIGRVEKLEQSEGWKNYEKTFRGKLHGRHAESTWNKRKNWIIDAFLLLKNKPPEEWEEPEYDQIWRRPTPETPNIFWSEELDGIIAEAAATFHNLMKATNKTQGFIKRYPAPEVEKGKKKEFWLDEEEIEKAIKVHHEVDGKNDLLLLVLVGVNKGARISSLKSDIPDRFDWKEGYSRDYEEKVKEPVPRYLNMKLLALIKRYVDDCKIEGTEEIFPDSYTNYLKRLNVLMRAAGVKKYKRRAGQDFQINIGTHIFKHTYVTQASRHGVPAEMIAEQTGTLLGTLQTYYWAKDPVRLRHFMQGTPLDGKRETFVEWLDKLIILAEPVYTLNCQSDERCRRTAT
jgi:integrase